MAVADRVKRAIGGHCAPGGGGKKTRSCLRNSDVQQLRTRLKAAGKDPNPRRHATRCAKKDDACLLGALEDIGLPTQDIARKRLVPQAPTSWTKKPATWLTTPEFGQVMRQYEAAYPEFEFLGATPIDFSRPLGKSCVWPRICKFTLKQANARGKTKIGFVFNEDNHKEPGSHWICAFLDITKREFYYIDSVGNPVPDEIKALVARLSAESMALTGRKLTFRANTMPHQRGDNQCGMYCLFFIIALLTGTATYKELVRRRIPDSAMAEMRKVVFRPRGPRAPGPGTTTRRKTRRAKRRTKRTRRRTKRNSKRRGG